MLDDLLGRTALKDRIEALEAERDRLERRLAAESDRRREAVRDRQSAEERANRLEDRIAELEGRLERAADGDAEATLEFRRVERLPPGRCASVLDRLEGVRTGPEGAFTAMVADDLPRAVEAAFGERAALVARAAPCVAVTDDAGLVCAALAPVIPPDPFTRWGESFAIEREWFLPTGRFALALVRADLFALGEYDGEERRSFTGFESDVKGAHSKGGFSQARFERRRDAQVDEHLDRAREAIEARSADRLIVVGDRRLVGTFAEEAVATAPVGATGEPASALEDAFREFWRIPLYAI